MIPAHDTVYDFLNRKDPAETCAQRIEKSLSNQLTEFAKLSGLRANTNADVNVDGVLGLTNSAATVSTASRSKSGTSNASAVKDETTRRDALKAFLASLTVLSFLDAQFGQCSPELLHKRLADAEATLESDGAVPPPPEDQETTPMESLKSTNDEREKDYRKAGDKMWITYTLRSIRNTLKGLEGNPPSSTSSVA